MSMIASSIKFDEVVACVIVLLLIIIVGYDFYMFKNRMKDEDLWEDSRDNYRR